jgi:hypothetical protein
MQRHRNDPGMEGTAELQNKVIAVQILGLVFSSA